MQTILVIDREPPHVATQALEELGVLLVAVDDVVRARHALRNLRIDLWICDLSIDELNFRALHADSRTLNPNARILLTGPALSKVHAATLIKQGMGQQFIPKPWQPLALKNAIHALLSSAPEAAPRPGLNKQLAMGRAATGGGQTGGRRLIRAPREPRLIVQSRAQSAAAAVIANDGRYRLDELIGEGGMGRIYRAHDTLLDMEVAVKLLTHEFSRDEEAIANLKEETRLCMQLLHKHIVRVFNLEKRQDLLLIIMEYVKGESLSKYLTRMPQGLPPDLVLQIVGVMGGALAYAHGKGVLHKDLTPGNVIISDEGVLKLIDFGIAGRLNRQKVASEYIVGTPVYMSPEQLRGEVLDVRADIYSLGILVFQMLTGRLPHAEQASFDELAGRPHPPLVGVPPAVAQVLEAATAFDRESRWPSVEGFTAAFQAACRQHAWAPDGGR